MTQHTIDPGDEAATVQRIKTRYRGRMDTLLARNDPDERAQLALDLGFLIGLAERLFREQASRSFVVVNTPDGPRVAELLRVDRAGDGAPPVAIYETRGLPYRSEGKAREDARLVLRRS